MAGYPGIFDRALELYEKKDHWSALKLSLQAAAKGRKSAYTLALKSLARLALPVSFVRALKAAQRTVIHTLDYAYYLRLRKKLSGIKPLPGANSGNILFIVRDMGVSGVSKVNLDIIQGLARGPFQFYIVATSPANNTWRHLFTDCCRAVITPERELTNFDIWGKYFCRLSKKLNIQTVVVSNSYVGYHVLPHLKSEIPPVKTMDILHMEGMWGTTELSAWTIPYLDKRVLISNTLEDYMIGQYKLFGAPESFNERLRVIYNGIDGLKFDPARHAKGAFKAAHGISRNTRIISFIGRFSPQKLPCLFVDIANAIKRRRPAALKFVMAGDGEYMDEVKRNIKRYGLEGHFVLTGALEADKVAGLLADTYLLLIPSLSEGIPLVMFEAMLMGVPVVSAAVGAIAEVIEDKANGCLISPDEGVIEAFAAAVDDFLSGKLDYNEISKKARRTVSERYTIEKMIRGYADVFYSLHSSVKEKGRRPAA